MYLINDIVLEPEAAEEIEPTFIDEDFLKEGAVIHLNNGDTFILDESMQGFNSCTYHDFLHFKEAGLLKEVK